MTQQQVVDYLTNDCGCIVVRWDNQGYCVIRNVINARMSGVPVAADRLGNLKPATVCRICRTLEVEIPEEAKKAADIIDYIHNNPPK